MRMLSRPGIGLVVLALLAFAPAAEARLENPKLPPVQSTDTLAVNLVLSFSAPVNLGASIVEVRDAHNVLVETGKLKFGANGTDVEIPLSRPLPAGSYAIRWRAVSGNGHVSVGGYAFTVEPSLPSAPSIAQQ